MPVDEDLKIEKEEGKDYPPLPKDVYQVQLFDVNQEVKPTYDTRNKPEDQQEKEIVLNFQFTLLEGKDGETDLRGRNVWRNFVPSYLYISSKNGKNVLFRIIEALLGREITREEEAEGFSGVALNTLIGKQCRISVEPKTKGDKTYDNITDFLKANNDLEPLTDEEKEKAKVKSKNDDELSAKNHLDIKDEEEEEETDIESLDF